MVASLQGLIDDFFADKITAKEYVDVYHKLYRHGNPPDRGAVYGTIWLSNDEYYPEEAEIEVGIDATELKAQIKLFLEKGVKNGYKIFHQYGGNRVTDYYKEQGIPLDSVIYIPHDGEMY
ncbi:hypothetical protein [Moraxella marmotae]|uniref:hypothetical protein n=1 Tax=Moraxella marmotae TaxID=3344520 RepID=UPI0035F3C9E7